MNSNLVSISFDLNGETVRDNVPPRLSLLDYLRDNMALKGVHSGCEMGSCGACLVMVDGNPIHGCLMLAAQLNGKVVKTVEGLSLDKTIANLQEAFYGRNALQCGYCTSGMLMSAQACLKNTDGIPSRVEIREALSGNYCRCTGYEAIVDAIETVAITRAQAQQSEVGNE